jgi:cytochrome c oxidase subunit II
MEVNKYEKLWIGISVAAIIVMIVALAVAGFGLGVQLPGAEGRVDPRKLVEEPPFDKPGVYEVSPGKYQVIMVARVWQYNPAKIEIPVGSEVTFKITSVDVTHGLYIEETNVNVMIVPGQISEVTQTFNDAGTFNFYCHEYCGSGHQAMAGQVIVSP